MMKKIFDDIRKEIDIHSDEACFLPDDTMVVSESRLKQILDEAEVKWESECCIWKQEKILEFSLSDCVTSCGHAEHYSVGIDKYCRHCGKPIKISEVE